MTGGCDTIRTINVTTIPLLTAVIDTTVCENQLPFTIYGHVFTIPGSVTDTVASTTGSCDTIRTINVTTIPLLTAVIDTTVCENQLPFTIYGHVFTAAGSVTDTVASTTGSCDTIRTINVTTIPLLTAVIDTTVCENQLPFTIYGHVFTIPGSVTDTVTSTTGSCDTIRTINVTTIPLLTAVIDTTVCENQLPFTIYGHVFTIPGSVTDTVASTTGSCDTIRTINVTTIPLLTAVVDTTVCENQLPFTIYGHVFTIPGSVTDTVACATGGCDTIRTINVTTIPLLTAVIDTTVCENQLPFTIYGHVFTAAGSVTDTVASTTGSCDTIRTINVTTIPLLTATVDTTVCENQLPFTIYGHVFTIPGSVIDTVASVTGGCDTIRTINVTTIPLLTAVIDTTVCENQLPFTIYGHVFTAAGSVTDTVASTTGSCDTIRTINVTTIPLLTAVIDTTVCENQLPFTIYGHVFTAAGSVTDTVASATGGCDTIRTINVTTIPLLTAVIDTTVCENQLPFTIYGHVFIIPGSVIDTVASVTGGCDTIRTINVTTIPLLTAVIDTTVCENQLPFTIYGHVFIIPGSVIDTVASVTGSCDTIRTINVTTIPLLTATVTVEVCASAFPYNFDGHLFTAPATITDTVLSTTGDCDTIRTITVTELPLLTSTVAIEVCASAFPYTFDGHIFSAAGSVIDTVLSTTSDCDTIRTITVTELPLLTSAVTIEVCASAFPYTFDGHVFSEAGSLIDTVLSTTGDCDTVRTITVTELPLLTSAVTIEVCASAFPYTFDGHLFTAPATITDTVLSTTGDCDTIRTITVTELPLLTSAVTIEVCASAFPYTFERHLFITPGSVIDTVASTTGDCDTVRTITVTELPLLTSTVAIEVCASAFPYTFGGHVFIAAGSVIDTVLSTTGDCDTIRTITVTELPLLTSAVAIEVCASAFPYTFDGHLFAAPATITDTVLSTTGDCDTIRTITVTELALLTGTVNIEVCASAFPYTFDGHVFSEAGSLIDTVLSTTGDCDTIRTITVTELPLHTSTVAIEVCASAFPYTFDGHLFAAPATITDTVLSTTGDCDTIRTITVTELPLLTSAVTIEVCASAFPYTFERHLFITPGSVIDTVASTTGDCDTFVPSP